MLCKLLIWTVVLFGLAASLWVAFNSYYAASLVFPRRFARPELRLSPFTHQAKDAPLRHDTTYFVSLGKIRAEMFPRRWAACLIGLGVVAVVTGLFFILHVRAAAT